MQETPDDERFGPRRSDPAHASSARVYDYLLGGTYNYNVDRVAAEQLVREFPLLAELAKSNRLWVQRAVRYLAVQCGVRQFLDIGSGIPTAGNVHEIAQAVAPTACVVYVDYEKVAVDVGRELLDENPYAISIHADMRQPRSVLDHPDTRVLLDFDKPIAMIWASVLHFVEDSDDPFGIVARYKKALIPGSYLALSHVSEYFLSGRSLENFQSLVAKYNQYVAEVATPRDLGQLMRFFEGTELVEPGLVPIPDWRSDIPNYEPDLRDDSRGPGVCGVGRLV